MKVVIIDDLYFKQDNDSNEDEELDFFRKWELRKFWKFRYGWFRIRVVQVVEVLLFVKFVGYLRVLLDGILCD